jgi:hypothetical protein
VTPPPRSRSPDRPEGGDRSILALAQPSQETDELLSDLVRRRDLHLMRVLTVEAATLALRDLEVGLVLVCPQTPVEEIDDLLGQVDRLRPGVPVLALRERRGEESPRWKARGVGVLRVPFLSGVLARTVDVALGLSGRQGP